MPLAEFWSTREARSAAVAALSGVLTLLAVGWGIYTIVEASMMAQLEAQLVEEAVLFKQLFDTGGMPALIAALDALNNTPVSGPQFAGLFDAAGTAVAGNLSSAPEMLFIKSVVSVTTMANGADLLELSIPIQSDTLVVGRDIEIISNTLTALTWTLLIAGAATTAIWIALGWWTSRSSIRKLRRIAYTLDRVGLGDTKVRTKLTGQGEIDRIGTMIDGALERLSALVAASQNTTRAVAHDLRTPLNRAMLTLQDAISAKPSERTELLEKAADELLGLGRIFDTLLQIGRLEAGNDRSGFERVDIREPVSDAVALIEDDIASKNQILMSEIKDPVWVNADPQMLVQLLVNLLRNANTHAPEGSQIIVRAYLEDNQPVLEVQDNGPGIPGGSRADVIKPFVRLDESRTGDGVGLGLALVNAIAVRHSATFTIADATPGVLARVVFPSAVAKIL